MKKVMHLLNSNQFSGAENVVCQIVDMMSEHTEYHMFYCSMDGPIRGVLVEKNIEFVPVSELTRKEIRRIIAQHKPDIIHAHDMRASYVASISSSNIPLISHIHNNNFDSRKISFKSVAYFYAALKAKHIFWVSSSSYKGYIFHNFFTKKSSVLNNTICIDLLYKKMRKDTNIYNYDVVYVGRFTYPKNPQRLLEILRLVVDEKPETKIALIGTGELLDETKTMCKKLRLEKNVDFCGFKGNPLKMIYDSKVMVMASRWEGIPMCVLESLGLGVPVVSTPTDGVKDVVKENYNGFLSDDNETLAKRIVKIVSDEKLQKRLSKNCYRDSLEYNNQNKYCHELLAAYCMCVGKN